jgi:N-acetylglucosamine-6-phosphate deacetylase
MGTAADGARVWQVGKNLLQYGVTSFCPTIVTSPAEKYHATLPRFVRYRGCPDRGAHNIGCVA